MSTYIVMGGIVVGTIVGMLLFFSWVKKTRRRSRKADSADLRAISTYADSHGLSILQAAQKNAFTASGTLEGIQVSLTTSNVKLIIRGRTAVGPIETHLRTRGLPTTLKVLVARPLPALGAPDAVVEPLTRGADLLPTGDGAFDSKFRCFAANPDQLTGLFDPATRQQVSAIPEIREVRLSDGELSISLIPPPYLGGKDTSAFHHVRPLVKSRDSLDRAAKILARVHAAASKLGT